RGAQREPKGGPKLNDLPQRVVLPLDDEGALAARLGELGGDSGEERLRVDLVAALLRRAREPATRPLRKSSSASRPPLPPSTGRPPWATARPRPPASALTSVVGDDELRTLPGKVDAPRRVLDPTLYPAGDPGAMTVLPPRELAIDAR